MAQQTDVEGTRKGLESGVILDKLHDVGVHRTASTTSEVFAESMTAHINLYKKTKASIGVVSMNRLIRSWY